MIVIDASAVVDLLRGGDELAAPIRERIAAEPVLHVPAIFELEVTQALRGIELRGQAPDARVDRARRNLSRLRTARYDHLPFLTRIWSLRHNLTAYDAAYVALAEAIGAPLVTTDRRLAHSAGHRARIELVAA